MIVHLDRISYASGCQSWNGAAATAQMHQQLTHSVTTGSSLAFVWKLLSWADQRSPLPPAFCEAISPGWSFDSFSFTAGLVCGVALYLVIEGAVTLKWAFIQWVGSRPVGVPRPLYKILHEQ